MNIECLVAETDVGRHGYLCLVILDVSASYIDHRLLHRLYSNALPKVSNPKSECLSSSIIVMGVSLRSILIISHHRVRDSETQNCIEHFGLIALYHHRRRFLSASLLIIPSSLRRKINKGRKLRKMPKSSEVLNSPLHPHCAPCCFPLRSANSGSAAAEQKVVLP